ncbi:MAG: PDZ domain-containing protein, partial [Thermoguttaceae bacterium]
VIAFFTGRHADYHLPTDTFDKVNFAGMVRIQAYLEDVLVALAESPARPEFAVFPPQPHGQEVPRAFFGSIPDITREEPGYCVSGVLHGSPADRAGVRGGDIILRLGKNQIGSYDDFDDALEKYAGGERVPITIRRGDRSLTYQVTLEAAK